MPPVAAIILVLPAHRHAQSPSAFACAVIGPEHSSGESNFGPQGVVTIGQRIGATIAQATGGIRGHRVVTRLDCFSFIHGGTPSWPAYTTARFLFETAFSNEASEVIFSDEDSKNTRFTVC
jgi:hypothetical protein